MPDSTTPTHAELLTRISELEVQREAINTDLRKLRKAAVEAEQAELEERARALGLLLLEQYGDGDSVLAALENGCSESPNSNRDDGSLESESGSDFDHGGDRDDARESLEFDHGEAGQAAPWRSAFDRGDTPAPRNFAGGEAVGDHVG